MHHNTFGQLAEKLACDYLQQRGLVCLQKNFKCSLGEIDLIMRDKDTLIFVEVRARQQQPLLHVLESITPYKQRRIIKTAMHYLQKHRLMDKFYCRFDVIAVHSIENDFKIDWIKQAFEGNNL